ncbi:MAG: hypothetical protein IT434_08985 [Phycisphaerales bacterium]|jgi:hypothetical protein|nr:hypothetical protein [Phycisphaerales bacterium]
MHAASQHRQGGMKPVSMSDFQTFIPGGHQSNRNDVSSPVWQVATTLDRGRYLLTSPILAGALLAEPTVK